MFGVFTRGQTFLIQLRRKPLVGLQEIDPIVAGGDFANHPGALTTVALKGVGDKSDRIALVDEVLDGLGGCDRD
jgi:hypothetical protein